VQRLLMSITVSFAFRPGMGCSSGNHCLLGDLFARHGLHLVLEHLYNQNFVFTRLDRVCPIFNSIKVIQQVNYKVTRLQKCFGTTNQPF